MLNMVMERDYFSSLCISSRCVYNWVIGSTVMNTYSGFAKAFELLGETGVELSPMASGYIEYFGTEASGMPNPVMMLVGVTGLLIALSPLWLNTSD